MRHLIIISSFLFIIGCTNNHENETLNATNRLEIIQESDSNPKEVYLESNFQNESISNDKKVMDFLKLADKAVQVNYFHQLDSIRKIQYPNKNEDSAIFVDLTPKLLNKFIKDLDKDKLFKTCKFEKEYNFNIAPPQYTDSKECIDMVSLYFDKKTFLFQLKIANSFFAEWCQESVVVYTFKVDGSKILVIGRDEAG